MFIWHVQITLYTFEKLKSIYVKRDVKQNLFHLVFPAHSLFAKEETV